MRSGQPKRQTHACRRQGTSDLLATLNVRAGTAIGWCTRRQRPVTFRTFLDQVEANCAASGSACNASDHRTLYEALKKLMGGEAPGSGRYGRAHPRPRSAACQLVLRAESGSAKSRAGGVSDAPPRHPVLVRRRFRPYTTDSRHGLPIAPNLLKQQFLATLPDTVWLRRHHLPADERGLALPRSRP